MPEVKPPAIRPMKQTTVFDQAERLKQQGMEAAYQYADLDWKQIATKALMQCAQTKSEFTVTSYHQSELASTSHRPVCGRA